MPLVPARPPGRTLVTALALALGLAAPACVDPGDDTTTRTARDTGGPLIVSLGASQVRFSQVELVRAASTVVTAWGEIAIDPVAVQRATGVSAGFVSARTADRWLVVNVPIDALPASKYPPRVAARRPSPPSFVPPVRTQFGLDSERPLSSLAAQVILSTTPLVEDQLATFETQPVSAFPIALSQQDDNLGVLAPDPIPPDELAPPLPPAPWSPDGYDGSEFWEWTQPFEYNVEAAWNQCGVAALANNLAYLRQYFDLPVNHYLQKGIYGSKTLPGRLDAHSRRFVDGFCAGGGLDSCADANSGGMLDGLYGYLETEVGFDNVHLRHQGLLADQYPAACPALPDDGPVSDTGGDEVTFEWLCDRIANGDGVYLAYYKYTYASWPPWPGSPIEPYGGHAVRAYGCGMAAGKPYLRVLHDAAQDRFVGEDDPVCTEKGGLAWEVWMLDDVDGNGRLDINGSRWKQLAQAVAIEAL